MSSMLPSKRALRPLFNSHGVTLVPKDALQALLEAPWRQPHQATIRGDSRPAQHPHVFSRAPVPMRADSTLRKKRLKIKKTKLKKRMKAEKFKVDSRRVWSKSDKDANKII